MNNRHNTGNWAFAALILIAISPVDARPVHRQRPATVQPALYNSGMVSAADPRAAEAGAEMLRAGGSATDAAIATMLALSVVEPQSSGIGGGGFFVTSDAHGRVTTIDGRETAPRAAHGTWFWKDGMPMGFREVVPGGTSVGIPGNLALAAKAHAAGGRLAWARLFGPAIRLARDGWNVTPRFRAALETARFPPPLSHRGRGCFM
ncbi:MAG: gamma-glutamyltransferase, partial [Pseudomonadota bacterium]